MTLGTSLFWIAFIGLLIWGCMVITKKKKWKLVGKIVGGLVVLGILIGLGAWAWNWYEERPRPVDTLGALTLGMTPLEVGLAIGKPFNDSPAGEIDAYRRQTYKNYSGESQYVIKYSVSDGTSPEQAEIICTEYYLHDVLGLSVYSSEKSVLAKLGTPSNESIRYDGLAKMISYEKYNVAFEIEQGSVSSVCITSTGKITYLKEYGSDLGI